MFSAGKVQMPGMIECQSCGAQFDIMEKVCPYCGSTNLIGAKADYRRKLDDMLVGLDDMKDEAFEETGHELKRSGSKLLRILCLVIVIVAILLVISRIVDSRYEKKLIDDYSWKQEYFPKMDELYDSGEYEELLNLFEQAALGDHPVYAYEHAPFCSVLRRIRFVDGMLSSETGSGFQKEELSLLLSYELEIAGSPYRNGLTKSDLEYISEHGRFALEDLEKRFHLSPDAPEGFTEYMQTHDGMADYDACEEFVVNMNDQ